MAEIIPDLNQHTLSRMTSGEKRFARRLKELLEDDYLIWYDIPIGKQRRYPDFIILHPGRGLLFLEIKDWKAETIKKISKSDVELLTDKGLVTRPHPLEQVRQYTYQVIDCLSKDPHFNKQVAPTAVGSSCRMAGGVFLPTLRANRHKGRYLMMRVKKSCQTIS